MLIKIFIRTDVNVVEAEANLLYYRLIYSEHGISYHDIDIDRLYPGVIDLSVVLDEESIEETLGKAILYGDHDSEHIAAKITITDGSGGTVSEFYLNERLFEGIYPISFRGQGPGGVSRVEKSMYVLLKDKREYMLHQIDANLSWLRQDLDSERVNADEIDRLENERIRWQADTYEGIQYIPGKIHVIIVKQNT